MRKVNGAAYIYAELKQPRINAINVKLFSWECLQGLNQTEAFQMEGFNFFYHFSSSRLFLRSTSAILCEGSISTTVMSVSFLSV